MKDHLSAYKEKLEKCIGYYMEMPVSERSAGAVKSMLECWDAISGIQHKASAAAAPTLTLDNAKWWTSRMKNADGTAGPHWAMDQTSAVADSVGIKFEHIYDFDWWATMNMMYSDYCEVAEKFGVDTPEFFAELSKAFLFDADGPAPMDKIAAYYHAIVCPEMK